MIKNCLSRLYYPYKKMFATSIIYDYLYGNGYNDLISQYGLEPFEVNVQVSERTFVDKLYALGDYYLSGAIEAHSRHIYDLYKLSEIVSLDDNLRLLAKDVYEERVSHNQCHSAKPGVDMNELLQEIVDKKIYESDYENVTSKMLFEDVSYEAAITALKKVIEYRLF